MLRTAARATVTTAARRSVTTALTALAASAAALALTAPAAQAAPSTRTAPSAPTAQAAPSTPVPQVYAPPTGHAAQVRNRHTGPGIHRFLTWFYGQHGPTEQRREHFVSDFLKQKQAQNPDHDVILCAQNTPQRIEVGPVTVAQSAGFGWATVTAYWADGTTSTSTAYVALDSHPIELHDVVCAE
ncbi:hypothetical protein FM076_27665 [Streptomyces albus subsp. chlorinus]|uniref:hypothetical protein n=1 Tax=Streptomyces albus TaxID=1888 RepID=UPI001570FB7E|nr:hypothetical protein [Streptomyces albus]NSC24728.1 hypothetical protein [Streptomyces albus subsp. chlorinus]